jgi:hypothetical protein
MAFKNLVVSDHGYLGFGRISICENLVFGLLWGCSLPDLLYLLVLGLTCWFAPCCGLFWLLSALVC